MRNLSLTARTAFNAQATSQEMVVLVEIYPPDQSAPIRLTSHPTERLSIDPLRYGTISNGNTYEFVLMSVMRPDDQEGTPGPTSLIFENVVTDMASVVRSTIEPATVNLYLVLASNPDAIEEQYLGFKTSRATADANRVTIDISLAAIVNEPWPAHLQTPTRFPGLFP